MVQKFRDFSLKENVDLENEEDLDLSNDLESLTDNEEDDNNEEDDDEDGEIENDLNNDVDNTDEDLLLNPNNEPSKGSVVIINGCEADSEIDKKTSEFISKYGDCKEIFLYQLNIQTPKKQEPKDGMLQVYSAIESADAVIFACQIVKNKLSESMEIAIERIKNFYKKEELKNKVFGAIILGGSDEKIKNDLILTALNDFHMILSGDCLFFANDKSKSNMAKMVDTVKTLTDATAIINSGNYEDETETETDIKPFDEFIDSEQTEDPDEQSFGDDGGFGEEDDLDDEIVDETEDEDDNQEDSYSDGDVSESLLSFDNFFKKKK